MAIDYRWAVVQRCMSLGVGTSDMPVLLAPNPSKSEDGEQKQSTIHNKLCLLSHELFMMLFGMSHFFLLRVATS